MSIEPPETIRRIVYLGTPGVAVPPLHALVEAGYEIPLVVSRPDARRGRGKSLMPSAVKAAAIRPRPRMMTSTRSPARRFGRSAMITRIC